MTRELLRHPSITPIVIESQPAIAGTWNYESTRTSMFKELRVNIPREIMGFRSYSFGDHTYGDERQFPAHWEVEAYLKDYAKVNDLEKHISFNEEVTSVDRVGPAKWKVATNKGRTIDADGVCVCNGHYEVPSMPQIENVDKFEGKIMHSREYREASELAGKTVAILGAKHSGFDIGLELSAVCPKVYLIGKVHRDPTTPTGPKGNIHKVNGTISEYLGPRSIKVKDVKGEGAESQIDEVDVVLYATGYLYDFEIINANLPDWKWKDNIAYPLYKNIFYAHDPTLIFLGLPFMIIPLPLHECQAILVAEHFGGKVALPSSVDMKAEVDDEVAEFMTNKPADQPLRYFTAYSSKQYPYNALLLKMANWPTPFPDHMQAMQEQVNRNQMIDRATYRDMRVPFDDPRLKK